VFYTNDGGDVSLDPGAYLIEILEDEIVIGSVNIDMR
jgi:hypothetical protein